MIPSGLRSLHSSLEVAADVSWSVTGQDQYKVLGGRVITGAQPLKSRTIIA
jgi:hypothetical protein